MTQTTPGSASTPVPVCPRHPGRESYVRCQRCERPVCPDCQRPAAVGVQCVDCVREQNKGSRSARTVFGGLAPSGPVAPRATQAIIALCVIVFVLQKQSPEVTERLLFPPDLALAEPWRFLTAAFLHSPDGQIPLHILFNMYALWLTGPYLEAMLGRARFVTLYLLSAVGGQVCYFVLASPGDIQQWYGGVLGASGAVFGLFVALIVVNRRLKLPFGPIVALVGVNAVLGFLPGIAWQAHLGGALTGAVATLVLAYAPRDRRTQVQVGGLALIAVFLVLAVALKAATVPTGLLG